MKRIDLKEVKSSFVYPKDIADIHYGIAPPFGDFIFLYKARGWRLGEARSAEVNIVHVSLGELIFKTFNNR